MRYLKKKFNRLLPFPGLRRTPRKRVTNFNTNPAQRWGNFVHVTNVVTSYGNWLGMCNNWEVGLAIARSWVRLPIVSRSNG